MKLRSLFALSCCLAALSPLTANAQDTFSFNSVPLATFLTTKTPLSPNTVNTLTADNNPARTMTAIAPTPEQDFEFLDNGTPGHINYGLNLNGTVLEAASPDPTKDTLSFMFNQPITSLTVPFAIVDLGDTYALTLTGGGASDTESGAINPDPLGPGNYEGTLKISSLTPFSTVAFTFTSSGIPTAYALDNFLVTPAATAVPEPGTVALALALGLPVAWGVRRKLARK